MFFQSNLELKFGGIFFWKFSVISTKIFQGAEKGSVLIITLQTEAVSLKITITQEKNNTPVLPVTSGQSQTPLDPFAPNPVWSLLSSSEHPALGSPLGSAQVI